MSEARTVHDVFEETVKHYGSHIAHRAKRAGRWNDTTWTEYYDAVRNAARAFMHLGLEAGGSVALIGYNSPEWVIADVAAIFCGAKPAGIYTTSAPDQVRYIAHHSEARIAIAENAEQVAKFQEVRAKLPHLRAIVQIEGKSADPDVIAWDKLLLLGASVSDEALDERIRAQKPDDTCTLIYTSGTTGDPKAVMITHRNITWTAESTITSIGFGVDDIGVSYLPLSHIAEQMLTIHAPMKMGSSIAFSESIEKLPEALRDIRPTYFLGVPRVWEKMQAKMAAAGASAPPVRKKIAAWARRLGLAGGYADQNRSARPLLYPLADKLVFSKVKERLGLDRARICVTSAAPIARDTLEFFLSLGIPIYEVYGMSECTGPATFSPPDRYRTGKAGIVVPGGELKIADDGEVCMRGPHVFKGYFKDEASTRGAIDAEGWLHSGDVGTIDKEGFLQITDRKKDLLITSGGENIAPQIIEGMLKGIPVVAQAVVVGDRQRYLAALITLDAERIVTDAKACGSPARDVSSASTCAIFRAHVEKQIEAVNVGLARVQSIKRFTIIPSEFTVDGGELTPTMKVKRKVVGEKYKAEIAALYA